MKKEQAIFWAVFCGLLALAMVSLLVVAADSEGEAVSPVIVWLAEKLIDVFTFPVALIAKLFHAQIGSMIVCFLLDVALYAAIISYGIITWINKRRLMY